MADFKTTIITDEYGFKAENTPMGEHRVIEPVRLVGATFDGFVIDPNFWITSATGTGASIAQANAQLTITSGTASGATVNVYSVRKGRYVGGTSMRYRAVVQNAAGTANNTRRWGVASISNYNFTVSAGTAVVGNVYTVNSQQFTVLKVTSPTSIECMGTGAPSASGTLTFVSGPGAGNLTYTAFSTQAIPIDGAYFQLSGTTFSIVTLKEGVATAVDSGSFNGQYGTTYALTTSATTFEIYWTNTKVWFVIGDEILHLVTASATTWSNTMTMQVFADSINSNTASSVTMQIRTAAIYRMGKSFTRPFWKYEATNVTAQVLKRGPGILHSIVNNDSTGAITIYDAVSGVNLIAVIDCTKVFGPIDFGLEGLDFYQGLTYTTTGGPKVTIIYE